MLPKTHKLSREDLKKLGRKAEEVHSPHFLCRVYDTQAPHGKYTVVISGKVAKKAVVRNKIRRRVYSVIEKSTNLTLPRNVVIIAKKGAGDISFKQTKEEITKLLSSQKLT